MTIRSIISNKKEYFVVIRKGYIGLKGVHDHLLVEEQRKKYSKMKVFQRIVNLLVCGPMTIKNLSKEMPDVKEVVIKSEITKHPELFLWVKEGMVGRVDRDEYLRERYGKNV